MVLSDSEMDENKIVIYQTEDGQTQIDVRLENETVWLTHGRNGVRHHCALLHYE